MPAQGMISERSYVCSWLEFFRCSAVRICSYEFSLVAGFRRDAIRTMLGTNFLKTLYKLRSDLSFIRPVGALSSCTSSVLCNPDRERLGRMTWSR